MRNSLHDELQEFVDKGDVSPAAAKRLEEIYEQLDMAVRQLQYQQGDVPNNRYSYQMG